MYLLKYPVTGEKKRLADWNEVKRIGRFCLTYDANKHPRSGCLIFLMSGKMLFYEGSRDEFLMEVL